MKIGIIGTGGVGGYFGGELGAEVWFVARGAHLAAIRKEGLLIRTAHEGQWRCHPCMATDNIAPLPRLVCGILEERKPEQAKHWAGTRLPR